MSTKKKAQYKFLSKKGTDRLYHICLLYTSGAAGGPGAH